jgi:hypothetical protein
MIARDVHEMVIRDSGLRGIKNVASFWGGSAMGHAEILGWAPILPQ